MNYTEITRLCKRRWYEGKMAGIAFLMKCNQKKILKTMKEWFTWKIVRGDIMARIIDEPHKIKAKLIVEVEAEFYDNESSEETLRYCVEQDLEDAGLNVIDVSVMKWGDINESN